MAPNAVQGGPTRPKGVKMASKWPQIPQNGLFQAKFAQVLTGEGPPSTLGWVELELGPLSGGYSGLVHDFCPKVYIGLGVPYVHRVGGCTL